MSLQILAQSSGEQSDGTPLAIIISIVAAVAAVAAVIVSKRALDYTKGEPLRAAQRALDGQLREKVNGVIKDVEDLRSALRYGKNIPEEPPTLEDCAAFLKELAERRPNGTDVGRHQLTHIILLALSHEWRTAVHNQRRVDEDATYLEKRRAAGDTDLGERTARLIKDQRTRDARYLEVGKKAESALSALEDELGVLNSLDRREI